MTKVEQARAALEDYRERARQGRLLHGSYEGIMLERALWQAEQDEADAYAQQTQQKQGAA